MRTTSDTSQIACPACGYVSDFYDTVLEARDGDEVIVNCGGCEAEIEISIRRSLSISARCKKSLHLLEAQPSQQPSGKLTDSPGDDKS